jgi:hypothetical protein
MILKRLRRVSGVFPDISFGPLLSHLSHCGYFAFGPEIALVQSILVATT